LVGWGVVAVAAGVLALVATSLVRSHGRFAALLQFVAVLAIAVGLLAQHGGAVIFFVVLGATVFARMFVPGVIRWRRARREEIPPDTEPGSTAGAATVNP